MTAALSFLSPVGMCETSMQTATESVSIGTEVWPLKTAPNGPWVSARSERRSPLMATWYSAGSSAPASSMSSSPPATITSSRFSMIGGLSGV
ncbi:Uncharacterised protein [Mycobacteroides abscessus subsp. abscessus]|nr:Uncharacterised protein [Mycobacteroides abscessus subsp. abscessus]